MIVAMALAMSAAPLVQQQGHSCRQVMIGSDRRSGVEPGRLCYRPDGSSYLLNGVGDQPSAAPAATSSGDYNPSQFRPRTQAILDRAAAADAAAAATDAERPAVPPATHTREQVVSSLQGRPYNEVVAQQAAAERQAASTVPPPRASSSASVSSSAEIKAGLLTAWLNTPRFMPAVRMGLVRSNGTIITLDLVMMAETYRVEVAPDATCSERRGGALRCSYRMQFSGGASVLGSSPIWYPWGWVQRTDVFRTEAGMLRSPSMEAFVLANYGYRNGTTNNACATCTQDELARRTQADWDTNNAWRDWNNVH